MMTPPLFSTLSTLLHAVMLQIIAEPAPISSSTHLRFFLLCMGLDDIPHLTAVIYMAHGVMALLLAFFYRRVIIRALRERSWQSLIRYGILSGALALPAIGTLLVKNNFDFSLNPRVGVLFSAVLLIGSQYCSGNRRLMATKDFVLVSCAQALALFFGISRLASTYTMGMVCGLSGEVAFALAWFVALPIYAGAGLLGFLITLKDIPEFFTISAWGGIGIATLLGYFVLLLTSWLARSQRMGWWAIYMVSVVGLLVRYC